MNIDDLPTHEIERLYEAGLISDAEMERIAEARISPEDLALIDGIAYGIAKLLNTPINQLVAEADASRDSLKVSGSPGSPYNRPLLGGNVMDYRSIAINAVTQASHQAPVLGYLRQGQQQHVYLFPTLQDARTWFQQRQQIAGGYDYIAWFSAEDLQQPLAEDFGASTTVSGDPTQIGHWFLPLALGLGGGVAGGYAYRGWRDQNPGKWLPWISGEAAVGGYPWASIHDVGGPYFRQKGPWLDIVGSEPWMSIVGADAGHPHRKTHALIQSAVNDVREMDAMNPASAWVWSLDPPGTSPDRHVQLTGTTAMFPFGSYDQALEYVRSRTYEPHVAIAVFDKTSTHWPNPVNWNKSDDPSYAETIAQQISRSSPRVAGYPWYTIIGDAVADVRARAQSIATQKPGHAVGVIHGADGQWRAFTFGSLDDADDWFGSATHDRASYTYAAYFDKDASGNAFVANEDVGGLRTPPQPGAPIRRQIATTD